MKYFFFFRDKTLIHPFELLGIDWFVFIALFYGFSAPIFNLK